MGAAFKSLRPSAAETCAPIFHGRVTRAGKTSVRLPLSSVVVCMSSLFGFGHAICKICDGLQYNESSRMHVLTL